MPVSMDWAAGGAGATDYASVENISIAFIVLLFTLALNHYGKGMLKRPLSSSEWSLDMSSVFCLEK